MIVITLSKVPPSLRGDLTKWYQEVQTGVYVGNVSARVRDKLWERIMRDIGSGQATMVFNARNELGYQFRTTRRDYEIVDFDGIPMLKKLKEADVPLKYGFSNAAKFYHARMSSRKKGLPASQNFILKDFIGLDVETTGLDIEKDCLISIAAVKHHLETPDESFYRLIKINQKLSVKIVKLTGLTDALLNSKGVTLESALSELRKFVGKLTIVGYNLPFDDKFITAGYQKIEQAGLNNEMVDLMSIIKKTDRFLDNYKLSTVFQKYDIVNVQPHNALSDAQATMNLAIKLMKNGKLVI